MAFVIDLTGAVQQAREDPPPTRRPAHPPEVASHKRAVSTDRHLSAVMQARPKRRRKEEEDVIDLVDSQVGAGRWAPRAPAWRQQRQQQDGGHAIAIDLTNSQDDYAQPGLHSPAAKRRRAPAKAPSRGGSQLSPRHQTQQTRTERQALLPAQREQQAVQQERQACLICFEDEGAFMHSFGGLRAHQHSRLMAGKSRLQILHAEAC